MKDSINDQGLLDSARAKHIQKGSHVVRYENVERNINDIIYGDSKITPLVIADLNNLVEGVVLDDSIELEHSKRQIANPTPLTYCLIEMSDIFVADEDSLDSDSDEWIFRQAYQVQVELFMRIFEGAQKGQFGTDLQKRLMVIINKVISKDPQLLQVFELNHLLMDNRIEEYVKQLNKFNPYIEKLEDTTIEEILTIYEEAGIISSIYNVNLTVQELDNVLSPLLKEETYDFKYSFAKAASLAYQNFFGSKSMSVRLPAQLRYPQIHGIGTPRISYEIFKKIAELHKLNIEALVRYGGTIEIYIPPLLSVLLDRCTKPSDITDQLPLLRDEFESIRLSIHDYLSYLNESRTLKEQIEVTKEMKKAIEALNSTLTKAKKSLIYQTWDTVKDGTPMKMFTGTLDLLIEKDIEKQVVRRIHPFIDMWSLFLDVNDYGRLLVNIFGENRIDFKSFEGLKTISTT